MVYLGASAGKYPMKGGLVNFVTLVISFLLFRAVTAVPVLPAMLYTESFSTLRPVPCWLSTTARKHSCTWPGVLSEQIFSTTTS